MFSENTFRISLRHYLRQLYSFLQKFLPLLAFLATTFLNIQFLVNGYPFHEMYRVGKKYFIITYQKHICNFLKRPNRTNVTNSKAINVTDFVNKSPKY